MQIAEKPALFITGATGVPGLSAIKEAFESEDFSVSFVDAPFMKPFLSSDETEPVLFSASIKSPGNSIIIPLSEYWISYCISDGNAEKVRISRNALLSSRSKEFFYSLLASHKIDVPENFGTKDEALKALKNGRKIIIKPKGLHSGYGVEILKDADPALLDKHFLCAGTITNKAMRIMKIENNGAMISEFIEGTEYSADCFCFNGKKSLVRLCKKKIVYIKDKPCTAACQLVKPTAEIVSAVQSWLDVLFDNSDISFAQFDFIIDKTGRIVPIDFACRIGGGMFELLRELPFNVYAEAVKEAAASKDETLKTAFYSRLFADKAFEDAPLTQLNYLSTKSGYIINDNYPLYDGRQIINKHKGDYAISNPSSVQSRLAVVVAHISENILSDKFIDSLLLSEPYIGEKDKAL